MIQKQTISIRIMLVIPVLLPTAMRSIMLYVYLMPLYETIKMNVNSFANKMEKFTSFDRHRTVKRTLPQAHCMHYLLQENRL